MKKDSTNLCSGISEIVVRYRPRYALKDHPMIKSAEDAYILFMETWDDDTLELSEQFKVLLLNRAHRVLGIRIIGVGSSTQTIADIRLTFAIALKTNAVAMIIAHNHPSGEVAPSVMDKEITTRFVQAGKLLEVSVLDHLIVTKYGYYSFAEEGVL